MLKNTQFVVRQSLDLEYLSLATLTHTAYNLVVRCWIVVENLTSLCHILRDLLEGPQSLYLHLLLLKVHYEAHDWKLCQILVTKSLKENLY